MVRRRRGAIEAIGRKGAELAGTFACSGLWVTHEPVAFTLDVHLTFRRTGGPPVYPPTNEPCDPALPGTATCWTKLLVTPGTATGTAVYLGTNFADTVGDASFVHEVVSSVEQR
jgi:hypothetical protein